LTAIGCVQGLSKDEAVSKVWLTDQDGLVTSKRKGMAEVVKGFARQGGEDPEGEKLLESVKRVSVAQIGNHCVPCSECKKFGVLATFPLFCFLCTKLLAVIAC